VTGRLAHTVASDSLTTMGYRQRPAGRDRSSLATPWGNTIIGLIWWTSAARLLRTAAAHAAFRIRRGCASDGVG
jgi:hypothetical protein